MFEDTTDSDFTEISYDLPNKRLFTCTDCTFNTKLSAPMFNVFNSHTTSSRQNLPTVHGNKMEDLWHPDYDKNYKVFTKKDVENIASTQRAKKEKHRLLKKKDANKLITDGRYKSSI